VEGVVLASPASTIDVEALAASPSTDAVESRAPSQRGSPSARQGGPGTGAAAKTSAQAATVSVVAEPVVPLSRAAAESLFSELQDRDLASASDAPPALTVVPRRHEHGSADPSGASAAPFDGSAELYDGERFEGLEEPPDDGLGEFEDIDVSAVADDAETSRARSGRLLADRLILWAERASAYAADGAGQIIAPDGLSEWRQLRHFRRPPPPEFPTTMLFEYLEALISRD
jgi:hypothetical protein